MQCEMYLGSESALRLRFHNPPSVYADPIWFNVGLLSSTLAQH